MSQWLKLQIILVTCFVIFATSAEAQQGRVLEGQTFHSDALDRDWPYTIYLRAYVDALASKSETNRMHVFLLTGDHDRFHQITDGTTDLYLTLRAATSPLN